ncbi:adrenocorticotropic hormone receptor-like [Lingula anatina]|uniref:Adrenocorticotropic hormone receptor-like n=1 Tax=Lingula anatina TaxID=7574 RepID=A0A1S3I6V5_LINAN|nr:adrenocorticotropic hormone receptor-like [Lingula anatina]|eukprot:XP_013393943.1 adrenocorticotropic hormone receptor-like [Lingula anatina]
MDLSQNDSLHLLDNYYKNGTGQQIDTITLKRWFYPTVAAFAFIGLTENTVSVMALWFIPHRPWAPFHYLLLYLAVADWLLLAVCFVPALASVIGMAGDGQGEAQITCAVTVISDLSCYLILPPLMATTGLVVNQYVSVVKALSYSTFMTKRRTFTSIFVPCVLVTAAYLTFHGITCAASPKSSCMEHFEQSKYFLAREYFLACAIITLSVFNVIVYILIFAKAHEVTLRPVTGSPVSSQNKLATTVALLLGTVLLFWIPGTLTSIFYIIGNQNPGHFDQDMEFSLNTLQLASNIMFFFNPIVDPFIYGLRLREVREGYRLLFRKFKSWWVGDEKDFLTHRLSSSAGNGKVFDDVVTVNGAVVREISHMDMSQEI